MKIDPDLLDDIEAKAKAATGGNWIAVQYARRTVISCWKIDREYPLHVARTHGDSLGDEQDAAHIARMDPPTALAMSAALREAWAENERLRKAMAGFEADFERVLKAYNKFRTSKLNDELNDLRRAAAAMKGDQG